MRLSHFSANGGYIKEKRLCRLWDCLLYTFVLLKAELKPYKGTVPKAQL